MLARVSNIEAFRRWRLDEEQTVEDLVRWITTDEPSPAMRAGTAFHRAIELAQPGEYETLHANGHAFHMPEGTLWLPAVRELRAHADYGPLRVTGQVDGLLGKVVVDHKTTSRFDAERYLEGYQWRFYLDIFGADVFRWNVFEIREIDALVYEVTDPQVLVAYRYPALHEDCARLAADYHTFALAHLPGGTQLAEAA